MTIAIFVGIITAFTMTVVLTIGYTEVIKTFMR